MTTTITVTEPASGMSASWAAMSKQSALKQAKLEASRGARVKVMTDGKVIFENRTYGANASQSCRPQRFWATNESDVGLVGDRARGRDGPSTDCRQVGIRSGNRNRVRGSCSVCEQVFCSHTRCRWPPVLCRSHARGFTNKISDSCYDESRGYNGAIHGSSRSFEKTPCKGRIRRRSERSVGSTESKWLTHLNATWITPSLQRQRNAHAATLSHPLVQPERLSEQRPQEREVGLASTLRSPTST